VEESFGLSNSRNSYDNRADSAHPFALADTLQVRLLITINCKSSGEIESMKTHMPRLLLAAALTLFSALAVAEDPRPYTEGAVTHVSFIRVKPGMFENYLKYLATTYKSLMDEYKKQGIILDYKVFNATETHSQSEPNLILTVVYKNMAAFDGLTERTDPVAAKVFGTRQKQSEAAISREAMREQVGEQFVRELILK
jgi:hypothetical protein